ncbi:uncharacterized protein LOC122400592 [Colletes gigas]|uniref:uncharacterized protein LOC122400592 n=1 Tax=Colletes gigas TaxID=935657 RepID=UPI001C9BAF32|nr:uncharacterized protein LOC122400592 [Colletes gigas]
MTEIANEQDSVGYYLPHHAVIKEASSTTKHAFVLIADMEKMYRQIIVHPDDRKYQRILWRESTAEAIKTFELNTITYGTAPAPFLATRSLNQLAKDEAKNFPVAAEIFTRDFYMDDLLTGADSYETALDIKQQCVALARAGGFHLRQWTSNDTRLIADLQLKNQQQSLCLDPSQTKKTLGVYWNPANDQISYSFKQISLEQSRITKRVLLSQIAQLFDPIGLLEPVIIKAKIVMQQLWKSAVDWDEPVPQRIEQAWIEIRNELHLLNSFTLPRRTAIQNAASLELHGFSDASESAYGACIYIRSTNERGQHAVNLLCAKSRVAPLKTISLPRLELCAARLLVKLYKEVRKALHKIEFKQVRFWSDSTITLHWIKTPPHLLKTFVANRVNEIQTEARPNKWFHIATADNPVDFVSRGQLPSQLLENTMWKFGPHWLGWQTEYLQELHTRSRWHLGDGVSLKEGTLATIRDDNCQPLQWQMGRIIALHPGEDGVVRVVTIQTPHGMYKRALKKVAPLPIETNT